MQDGWVTCAHERLMSDVRSGKQVRSDRKNNGLHGVQSYAGMVNGTSRQGCIGLMQQHGLTSTIVLLSSMRRVIELLRRTGRWNDLGIRTLIT